MSKKKSRRTSLLAVVEAEKANPNYQTVVMAGPSAIPVMMPRNMRAYLQEGYRNKTAFRVVGQIARSGAGIKWKHYYDQTKQREYSSSPLLDLWNRPNSEQGGSKFRENLLGYYCLTGNSYVLGLNASQNPKAKFDELYCLRPDLTKVHISDAYEPDYYEFGPAYPYKNYPKPFVMHSKLFAGSDDVYGLSPVEVAAMLVDIQKASQKWNLSLMSNMAAPSGAWVTKQILNDPDYRNLKKEIHDKFSGPRNAREPVILHGGVEWQSMSMTPMELDFLSSDEKTDRDIAGIFFNFPTFLLGLADATFANQSEAKHYLYTDIIFPIWDMFVDDLNSWLTPRYGGWLDYDREDVETIQERIQAAKAQASDRAMAEFAGGTTTFAEAREIQGKPALSVKDFVMLKDVPVHVDSLDEYIQAITDKVISPPPPPPQLMLPHPGGTTVTEEPQNEDGNTNHGDDEPNDGNADDTSTETPDNADKSLEHSFVRTAFEISTSDPAMTPTITPLSQTKALDLTTAEQKEAYFNSMEALRGKWETEIQKRVADNFSDERKTVLAAIERDDDPAGASNRIEHALSVVEQQGTLKQLIVKLYQDVGSDIGSEVLQELKCQASDHERKDGIQDYLNLFGPDVLIYLLQLAATKVKQITDTTRAEIQSALEEGVRAGEGVPKLAKRIDDLYLVEIIPNRSALISATEVVAASNYGSQQAAKASGLTLKKVWLSTSDSRTRPDHAAADGQEVDMDDPFIVGGAKLMYPGDSITYDAPAKQTVACRCTQYYRRVKKASQAEPEEEPIKSLAVLSRAAPITRKQYRAFLKHLPGQHNQANHGRRRTFKNAFEGMDMAEKEKFLAENGGTAWRTTKLTVEEKAALRTYTGSAYREMNGYLRGKKTAEQVGAHTVTAVEHAKTGLLKGKAPADMVVTRGYGHSQLQSFIDAAKAGGNKAFFEEKGFVSTTIKEKPDFAGFRVKINVFKNAPGGYVDPFSKSQGEQEFLLPPGAKIKITKATQTPSGHWTFEAEYKGTTLKKPKKSSDELLLQFKHEEDDGTDKDGMFHDASDEGGMMPEKFVSVEGDIVWLDENAFEEGDEDE